MNHDETNKKQVMKESKEKEKLSLMRSKH